jgi:4-hydroxy-4-methyl-2-oxoglutarate aldolase
VSDEAAIRSRLQRLSAAVLEDAQGKRGALPSGIARLHGSALVAGPAVTARCPEGSVGALLRALAEASAGDVLVAQGPGECAYFGELTGAEATRRGVSAIVLDGLVRDLERLRTLPLSIFARGVSPHGALPDAAGETQVVLEIGAELVRPGDWIVADLDGVVVVPAAELEQAVVRAEELTTLEDACFQRVLAGESFFDQLSQDGTTIGERISPLG